MVKLKLIVILISIAIVNGCAPTYRTPGFKQMNRQKAVRQSYKYLQECMKNTNRNLITNRLLKNITYYIGTPYKYGGDSRRGIDCSGFVSVVFQESFNIKLPHNVEQLFQNYQGDSTVGFKIGDLVFFQNLSNKKIDHVGIYLANNYFAHTSSTHGVIVSKVTEHYYLERFAGIGRVLDLHNNILQR